MHKLALFGPIGAGKTETANRIKMMYEGVEVFSFASPFKKLAKEILGRDIEKAKDRMLLVHLGQGMRSDLIKFLGIMSLCQLLYKSADFTGLSKAEEFEITERLYLTIQRFTSENPNWGYQGFWIDYLIKEIDASGCEIAVIDDMRFQAEYDALNQSGFSFAKVYAPDNIRESRLIVRDGKYNKGAEAHPSELEWPKFPVEEVIGTYDGFFGGDIDGFRAMEFDIDQAMGRQFGLLPNRIK